MPLSEDNSRLSQRIVHYYELQGFVNMTNIIGGICGGLIGVLLLLLFYNWMVL